MDAPPIMSTEEAATYLGVSVRWLSERRKTDDGPPYSKLHDKAIRYVRSELDAWVLTLSTGDHGAVATTGDGE